MHVVLPYFCDEIKCLAFLRGHRFLLATLCVCLLLGLKSKFTLNLAVRLKQLLMLTC